MKCTDPRVVKDVDNFFTQFLHKLPPTPLLLLLEPTSSPILRETLGSVFKRALVRVLKFKKSVVAPSVEKKPESLRIE